MKHEDDLLGNLSIIKSPANDAWQPLEEGSIARLSAVVSPTISTDEALKGMQMRRELRSHFYNLPFPVTLFCIFVVMMLTHTPIHRMYYVNHGLAVALAPETADAMDHPLQIRFSYVRTIDDIEQWINDTVFPSVFTEAYDNHTIVDPSTTYRIREYNKIVGALELSVLNAEKHQCPGDDLLAAQYGPCFDFDTEHDITEGDLKTRNTRKHPWYTLYIPNHDPDPIGTFNKWKINGTAGGYYLGIGTREFHVKLTTYNGEHDMFTYMHFELKFGEGGGIEPEFHVSTVPTNPYKYSRVNVVLDIIVGLLALRLIIRRIMDIVQRARRHQRWINGPAMIEWFSIALLALYYESWYQLFNKFFASGFDEMCESLGAFYDKLYKMTPAEQVIAMENSPQPNVSDFIDTFRPLMEFLSLMSIATCLQLAVNVMSALQFHPTMSILSNTILSSLKRLGTFAFVFMLCVIALAASGCLLFGPQMLEYSSLDRALVTCINMIFNGGYEYSNIEGVNDVGVVWYWLSQSIITLVLANIMLAVIIAAHEEIIQVNNQNRSFLRETWWMIDDFCRTTLMCRDKRVQRFEECLVCESLAHVWSASDIALSVGISPDQAAHWILRIKQFASLTQEDSNDTRSSRSSFHDEDYRKDVNERIKALDVKLDLIIEFMRASAQEKRMLHSA